MGYIKDIKLDTGATNLIEPVLYAVTSGSTSAYTASIENFELVTGVVITLKIHTTNAVNATLKINSGAAKNIKYKNDYIAANALSANRFYSFLYDGSAWQLIGELDTNTTYSAGTGIAITDNTIRNTGVREITTSSDSNGALKVNTNGTETAVFVKGIENGYLNIHPENTPILIPFIHNDIAHLLERGGSATLKLNGEDKTANYDLSAIFDGSGYYLAFGRDVTSTLNTIVLEITCHTPFRYGSTIYIDFGSVSWRATNIRIDVKNNNTNNYTDDWTKKADITNNASGHYACWIYHTAANPKNNGIEGSGSGFNQIRFTLSGFQGQFRIAQIGVYNYSSIGVRETYMSRGKDDPVFRSITPNTTNIYNLGSNDKTWKGIYATNFYGSGENLTNLNAGNLSSGTVAIANGGTNATTAAGARTNLGLGTIATETATNYLKWQTTSITTANTIYDFGVYVNQGSADTSTTPSGISYYNILNIPYRKASGNNKADYAWSIGSSSNADNRLFFRTSGPNTYGVWQEVAHAPVGTAAIGSATQPVYMTQTGVITAGTALKALAYKDNLVASDIPDISGTYATKTYVDTNTVAKTGSTMTGQLKTSFKQSVAIGSCGSSQTTVDGLCEEMRYSSGCMGSINIETAYVHNGITIPVGWYTYIWVPHRSGGLNGAASGDNCNYGTLYLNAMTAAGTNNSFVVRYGYVNSTAQILLIVANANFNSLPVDGQVLIGTGAYGHIKSSGYTIAKSVPSNAVFTDTNNAATHTLNTTTKYYVTGTTSATTSTSGDTFDTGVYVTTTAGELSAVKHSFNVSGTEKATMQYNNDIESIVFSFV